jgi:Major Facilitator Superfamily
MPPGASPVSQDVETELAAAATTLNASVAVVVPVRVEEEIIEAAATTGDLKDIQRTQTSMGSTCCEDDSRGEVTSLSDDEDEDDKGSNNHSRDMTEATDLFSVESNCPDDAHGKANSDLKMAPLSETNDVASNTSSSTPPPPPTPAFYRLNASVQDYDIPKEDTDDLGNVAPSSLKTESAPDANGVTVTNYKSRQQAQPQRCVRFKDVCIREYDITIGVNPYCSHGVPISLDWSHGEERITPLDLFEASHKRKRISRRMLLNSFQRRDMLWRSGFDLEDIEKAIKANDREKFRRSLTVYLLPLYLVQETLQSGLERCFSGNKDNDALLVQQIVQEQQSRELRRKLSISEVELAGIPAVTDSEEDRPLRRRLSFRSSQESTGGAIASNSIFLEADESVRSHEKDNPYAASTNSIFREYSVRVDRGQHDKASEIILCNLQRPHMRAFHAAWFSFFTAFFVWFAVTPLLGEIKDTLNLTNDDIWTSSLCGTAGVIVMRIFMGPACDKFGSRICMACILVAASVPCALTGLVQTSQGLSAVRSFVGIAGSSFVACQYWTSQMFTREVAGTANAIVAGWGNLGKSGGVLRATMWDIYNLSLNLCVLLWLSSGGGMTQIVMGSVLFPLFKLIFSFEDNDGDDGTTSSEMAWRTVFIVPAVMSLVAAYVIVFHCDDSPKGAYVERVRQQEILVVDPVASLCAAAQNWNVWILLVQVCTCIKIPFLKVLVCRVLICKQT